MRLQCSPPTRYVKNGKYPWCALFRNISQNWSIGCLLALYGSTVHPRSLYGSTMHPRCIMWFSGQFFLLSVHASLRRKKE